MNEQQTTHTKSIEEMIDSLAEEIYIILFGENAVNIDKLDDSKQRMKQAMRELVGEVLGEDMETRAV